MDATYEIWSQSAKWLQTRCCLKALPTTDNGPLTGGSPIDQYVQ